MDPRDLPSLANGVECAACGRLVPSDRIRILARRESLAFVELDCDGCRSESLGIVVGGQPEAESSLGELLPGDRERFREARPIDADDVIAARELLARHGLAPFLGGSQGPRDTESTG